MKGARNDTEIISTTVEGGHFNNQRIKMSSLVRATRVKRTVNKNRYGWASLFSYRLIWIDFSNRFDLPQNGISNCMSWITVKHSVKWYVYLQLFNQVKLSTFSRATYYCDFDQKIGHLTVAFYFLLSFSRLFYFSFKSTPLLFLWNAHLLYPLWYPCAKPFTPFIPQLIEFYCTSYTLCPL